MRTEIPLLQNVRVASPCPASWSEMTEVDGDRVRFCDFCRLNVYNLSAMGQAEAEGLLRQHEGRLCVRYFRRRDGLILTKDCPVGQHAVRLMFLRRSIATAALFLLGLGIVKAKQNVGSPVVGDMPAPQPIKITAPPPEVQPLMGAVAIQPPVKKPVEVEMGDVEVGAIAANPPREEPVHLMGELSIAPPKPEDSEELGRIKMDSDSGTRH